MKVAVCLLALVLPACVAQAQPALPPLLAAEPETVYSEAQREKDEQLSRRFVQSLLHPSTNLEGQFSRWKQPLCPHVVGMAPLAAQVVEKRIRDIARQVGAPLSAADPCVPNVVVFMTSQPQVLLDAMTAQRPMLFVSAPSKELTVRHPVQAWYGGIFRDSNGVAHPDVPWEFTCPDCLTPPPIPANVTRLRLGIQPEMGAAVILADAGTITGLTLGTFGDYLALMALAQTPATGKCQPAPSIANLFLTDCESDLHVTALSDADTAMLTALYQTPDEPEKLQGMRLIGNMRRNLEGESSR